MKRIALTLIALAAFAIIILVLLSGTATPEPEDARTTKMVPTHPPNKMQQAMEQGEYKARMLFGIPGSLTIRNSGRTPLKIGDGELEWTVMSMESKTGWLMFTKPGSNAPIWEFAACKRTNLEDLAAADLEAIFVRTGDLPAIQAQFNASNWLPPGLPFNGRGIPVKEGQVVLTKLIESPQKLFAIKLFDQTGTIGREMISVKYVEFDLSKPSARVE